MFILQIHPDWSPYLCITSRCSDTAQLIARSTKPTQSRLNLSELSANHLARNFRSFIVSDCVTYWTMNMIFWSIQFKCVSLIMFKLRNDCWYSIMFSSFFPNHRWVSRNIHSQAHKEQTPKPHWWWQSEFNAKSPNQMMLSYHKTLSVTFTSSPRISLYVKHALIK